MDASGEFTENRTPRPDRSDSAPRKVSKGSGESPVDVPYALWLACVATSLMSAISVTLTLVLYLLDNALSFSGQGTLFGQDNYFRILELSAIFAAIAIVTHFLRLRLEAMRKATVVVPLPFRLTVQPSGDLVSRFEVSCKVAIALDHDGPAAALIAKQGVLKEVLENAFLVAVTDPVIRFSKQKMEQTLKVAAVHVLGDGVAFMEITDMRHRRVPAERPKPQPIQDTAAEEFDQADVDTVQAQAG